MRQLVKPRILAVEPYRPGKPIDEVKRELGLKKVIKLASNETPYGPSPKVLQAITKAARSVNRYPDSGCFYLRQALAKKLKISTEQLIFGNGSDEIILLALRAFVDEGDEVIIAKPSFLIYEIGAKIVGANIKAIPLKNFHYDLEGMAEAVTSKTKLTFPKRASPSFWPRSVRTSLFLSTRPISNMFWLKIILMPPSLLRNIAMSSSSGRFPRCMVWPVCASGTALGIRKSLIS